MLCQEMMGGFMIVILTGGDTASRWRNEQDFDGYFYSMNIDLEGERANKQVVYASVII